MANVLTSQSLSQHERNSQTQGARQAASLPSSQNLLQQNNSQTQAAQLPISTAPLAIPQHTNTGTSTIQGIGQRPSGPLNGAAKQINQVRNSSPANLAPTAAASKAVESSRNSPQKTAQKNADLKPNEGNRGGLQPRAVLSASRSPEHLMPPIQSASPVRTTAATQIPTQRSQPVHSMPFFAPQSTTAASRTQSAAPLSTLVPSFPAQSTAGQLNFSPGRNTSNVQQNLQSQQDYFLQFARAVAEQPQMGISNMLSAWPRPIQPQTQPLMFLPTLPQSHSQQQIARPQQQIAQSQHQITQSQHQVTQNQQGLAHVLQGTNPGRIQHSSSSAAQLPKASGPKDNVPGTEKMSQDTVRPSVSQTRVSSPSQNQLGIFD